MPAARDRIAARPEGIPELIEDKRFGELFDPDRPDELPQSLLGLTPENLGRMRTNCTGRVAEFRLG